MSRLDAALTVADLFVRFAVICWIGFVLERLIDRYVWSRHIIKNNSRANDRGDGLELETLMAANAANGWGRARLAAESERKAQVDEREVPRVRLDRTRPPARARD